MASYDYLIVGGGMTADAAARGIRERYRRAPSGSLGPAPANRPTTVSSLTRPLEGVRRLTASGVKPTRRWSPPRPPRADGRRGELGRSATIAAPPTVDRGSCSRRAGESVAPERAQGTTLTSGYPRRLPRRRGSSRSGPAASPSWRRDSSARDSAAALRMQGREVTMVAPGGGSAGALLRGASPELPRDRMITVSARARNAGGSLAEWASRGVMAGSAAASANAKRPVTTDAGSAGLGIVSRMLQLACSGGLAVRRDQGRRAAPRTQPPQIDAAGDVAQFLSPALGEKRTRVEHEDNANTMGKIVVNMAGAHQPYEHLPFLDLHLLDLGTRRWATSTPGTRPSSTGRRSSAKAWSTTWTAAVCAACSCGTRGTGGRRPRADRRARAVPARAAEGPPPGQLGVAGRRRPRLVDVDLDGNRRLVDRESSPCRSSGTQRILLA